MRGLARDLGSLVDRARVRTEPEDLFAYQSDATHYYRTALPDAVVLPENTEEVVKVARYAYRQGIPLVPRGAGSGLAGGCTPVSGGIVLDMKRMNRIVEIDRSNMTASVESGVVLSRLHRAVERLGLFYPPDPQSMSVCTIGGNVATRAGGPRGVKYGTTAHYVLGLKAVLADGTVIETGGKFVKQSVGYDLTHLFTGSEGTLGIITSVNLRLIPLPETHRTMVVVCETLDQAAQIVAEMIASGAVPAVLEFLIKLAIMVMNNYIKPPLPTGAEAYLLMEFDGTAEQVARDTMKAQSLCLNMNAREVRIIEDEEEAAGYWRGRANLYPLMLTAFKRVITEDVTVPRSRIPDLVRAVAAIAATLGIGIGIAGHAGDGNVHPTILQSEVSQEMEKKAREAIESVIREGLKLGGTISGEHGIGIHKAEYLAWDLKPEVIALMKRIKAAFDPTGIMNPGKIWGDGDRVC